MTSRYYAVWCSACVERRFPEGVEEYTIGIGAPRACESCGKMIVSQEELRTPRRIRTEPDERND